MNNDSLVKLLKLLKQQINICPSLEVARMYRAQLHDNYKATKEWQQQLRALEIKHVISSPVYELEEVARKQMILEISKRKEQVAAMDKLYSFVPIEHLHIADYYKYNTFASETAFALSQSLAFNFQQGICEAVSSFGSVSTQVPSFERLPEETKKTIQSKLIIAEEKRNTKRKPKVRRRLITRIQKESLRAKAADWLTIIPWFWAFCAHINDTEFRQTILDNMEIMIQYVEYLWELLQVKN